MTTQPVNPSGRVSVHAHDEIPDETLSQLLAAQDELSESMRQDPNGTHFTDDEIARLLLLAGATGHLVRNLRAARQREATARAEARAEALRDAFATEIKALRGYCLPHAGTGALMFDTIIGLLERDAEHLVSRARAEAVRS